MVTSGEEQRSGDSGCGEGELKGLRVLTPLRPSVGGGKFWRVNLKVCNLFQLTLSKSEFCPYLY